MCFSKLNNMRADLVAMAAPAVTVREVVRRLGRPGMRGAFGPCLLTTAEDYARAGGHAEAGFLPDGTVVLAWLEPGRPLQVATRPPGGRNRPDFMNVSVGGRRALASIQT